MVSLNFPLTYHGPTLECFCCEHTCGDVDVVGGSPSAHISVQAHVSQASFRDS